MLFKYAYMDTATISLINDILLKNPEYDSMHAVLININKRIGSDINLQHLIKIMEEHFNKLIHINDTSCSNNEPDVQYICVTDIDDNLCNTFIESPAQCIDNCNDVSPPITDSSILTNTAELKKLAVRAEFLNISIDSIINNSINKTKSATNTGNSSSLKTTHTAYQSNSKGLEKSIVNLTDKNNNPFQINDTGAYLQDNARQYQLEYINECKKIYQAGGDRCIIKAPTGSGKTFMAMSIIKDVLESKLSNLTSITFGPNIIVLLSPLIDITNQLILPKYLNILHKYKFSTIIINSEYSNEYTTNNFIQCLRNGSNIIISGTYQSVDRILNLINQFHVCIDCLIMDEAHYLSGQDYDNMEETQLAKLVFTDSRVYKRLFISATPFYHQEINKKLYGPLVSKVTVGQLIKLGYLASIQSSICKIKDEENLTDYDEADELIDKAHGLNQFMVNYQRRKCIVFVNSKQHGYYLKNLIVLRGYTYFKAFTYFADDTPQILEDFRVAETPVVIITCKRINMGIDIPEVDSIVFADPRLSKWDISQCIGRGLRVMGNKICHCLLFENIEHNHMIMNYLNYVVNECEYKIIAQSSIKKNSGKNVTKDLIQEKTHDIIQYDGKLPISIELINDYKKYIKTDKTDKIEVVDSLVTNDIIANENIKEVDKENNNKSAINLAQCPYCKKVFSKTSKCTSHMLKCKINTMTQSDTTKEKFKCVCGNEYAHKKNLGRHQKECAAYNQIIHTIANKNNSQSTNSSGLINTIKINNLYEIITPANKLIPEQYTQSKQATQVADPNKCPYCSKVFPRPVACFKHMLKCKCKTLDSSGHVVPIPEEKKKPKFKCICDKEYTQKKSLDRHQKECITYIVSTQ